MSELWEANKALEAALESAVLGEHRVCVVGIFNDLERRSHVTDRVGIWALEVHYNIN